MRRALGVVALLVLAAAAPLRAEAPDSSLRPAARPAAAVPAEAPVAVGTALAPDSALRPQQRPRATAAAAPDEIAVATAPAPVAAAPQRLPARARIPPERRSGAEADEGGALVQTAAIMRVKPGRSAVVGRKGSVCGVNGIKGEALAPITSRVRGCGIEDPVRVTSVDGVALSMAATLDCPTARALHDWVRGALKPAFGRNNVVQLQVAAHYACRPRNNVKGAPISEHGRGKAIDISAIVLKNGKTVSVLDDWRNSSGKPMVRAYRAACGTFGTTLGPDSDRFHRNHMHFDTARHGNGPYCR